jgi:hypothetical protein
MPKTARDARMQDGKSIPLTARQRIFMPNPMVARRRRWLMFLLRRSRIRCVLRDRFMICPAPVVDIAAVVSDGMVLKGVS